MGAVYGSSASASFSSNQLIVPVSSNINPLDSFSASYKFIDVIQVWKEWTCEVLQVEMKEKHRIYS